MRARNIKPGFYKNAKLVECSLAARLLAPGLWMLADKSGRLLDRPKQIKMEIFPADTIDVEPLLQELHLNEHIIRYEIEGVKYIQILGFKDHQSPHYSEKDSIIPGYSEKSFSSSKDIPEQVRRITQPPPPDLLNPDSLTPDCSSNEEYKNIRAREISDVQDRHRLQFEIPAGWAELCKQEMGWNEKTIEAVWVKFSGHWKRKIGHQALKTDEEWDSEWRIWVCSSHIKQQKNTEPTIVSALKELTQEEIEKQDKWYKKNGIQHKIYNPEGLMVSA